MTLIKDGWWQDTWWASRWWQEDYWTEYGSGVAPAPSGPKSTSRIGKYPLKRKRKHTPSLFEDKEFLSLLIEFLENN